MAGHELIKNLQNTAPPPEPRAWGPPDEPGSRWSAPDYGELMMARESNNTLSFTCCTSPILRYCTFSTTLRYSSAVLGICTLLLYFNYRKLYILIPLSFKANILLHYVYPTSVLTSCFEKTNKKHLHIQSI